MPKYPLHTAQVIHSSAPSSDDIDVLVFSPPGDKIAFGDTRGRLIILGHLLQKPRIELNLTLSGGGAVTSAVWVRLPKPLSHHVIDIGFGGFILADATGLLHMFPYGACTPVTARVGFKSIISVVADPATSTLAVASRTSVQIWAYNKYMDGPIVALQELAIPAALRFRDLLRIYYTPNHLCVDDKDLYSFSACTYTFDKYTGQYISSSPSQIAVKRQLWLENRNHLPVVTHDYDLVHFLTCCDPDKSADVPSVALAAPAAEIDLVGQGTDRRILMFDAMSGKMLKHFSDNIVWSRSYINSLAIASFGAYQLVAAAVPCDRWADNIHVLVWLHRAPSTPTRLSAEFIQLFRGYFSAAVLKLLELMGHCCLATLAVWYIICSLVC